MTEPQYRSARLENSAWRDARQATRELSAALSVDLSLSDAIAVTVRYFLANPETVVEWERDQRTKGSDH